MTPKSSLQLAVAISYNIGKNINQLGWVCIAALAYTPDIRVPGLDFEDSVDYSDDFEI